MERRGPGGDCEITFRSTGRSRCARFAASRTRSERRRHCLYLHSLEPREHALLPVETTPDNCPIKAERCNVWSRQANVCSNCRQLPVARVRDCMSLLLCPWLLGSTSVSQQSTIGSSRVESSRVYKGSG